MSKDNVIQFPFKEGAVRPDRKLMLENRVAELNVENEMISSDLEFLGHQLDENLAELQMLLKQLESLVIADLEVSMAEIKNMTGVDLRPLMPEQDNPKED